MWSFFCTTDAPHYAINFFRFAYFRIQMARGNQRDLARAKNLKKQQEALKLKKEGNPQKRMEADAEKMRQKQAQGMLTRA